MKLISFAVPCYNSQDYMRKCIDSILTAGDEIEIIIVNDGSKDDTIKIANEYLERYPEIVKVVDKENGGHGSGVNAGLKLATGLYYKVVDSDDWLDEESLQKLMEKIKSHMQEDTLPDLYVTNFVYEKAYDNTRHVSRYTDKMPQDVIFGWDKVKPFKYSHMMLMHALLYKREKLIESGLELPEHTFYVDEIYAYQPLPYMKTICYLDLDLYRYFIGRSDQSINRSNFIKRYDQQIRVMQRLTDAYSWKEIKKMPKGLRKYMWHSLNAIMITTVYFICAEYSKDRKEKLKDMWKHIKERDKALYRKLRHRSYCTSVNYMPWGLRSKVMNFAYDRLCKTVKLG